jgi:hypothetical protein
MESALVTTGISNAAIASGLFVMVDQAVAEGVKLPTSALVETLGVTTVAATATGQTVAVQVDGIAKATAGGTVARGDYLEANTSGQVIKAAGMGSGIGFRAC